MDLIETYLIGCLVSLFRRLRKITPKCCLDILNDIFCVVLLIIRLLFGDVENIFKK